MAWPGRPTPTAERVLRSLAGPGTIPIVGWLSWLSSKRRREPSSPAWVELWTTPPSPRAGLVRGRLIARKERTWAGCTVMPNEAELMPTLLLLEVEGRLAPLKWLDPEREAALGSTPVDTASFIAEDPLLCPADVPRLGATLGAEVELYGLAYPMFVTGTICAITVWGLYVRPVAR